MKIMKIENSIYKNSLKISLSIFIAVFLTIILTQFTNLQLENYLNLAGLILLGSIFLVFYLCNTLNENKTKVIIATLFVISCTVIIINNLFSIEILSKYHPLLYSLLIPILLVFPFILKKEEKKSKKNNSKSKKKSLLLILVLLVILSLSFFLRIYNADTISPGRDSLHHYIAAKSINDNGSTVYETLPYINHMLAFIFENIGESLLLARLMFIIAGTLSVLLLYFIGRKISTSVGIISAVLLGICPWAIGLSRYIRDYSFNLLYELFFITLLLYFPKDITKKKGFIQFIILNLIIYTTLMIFAYFQKGITISIIIALLITTSLRIFIELNLFEKIKSLRSWKVHSKETAILAHTIIFTSCMALLVIVVFEFHKRITLTFQPKWLFFFLSDSLLPMLWYSFVQIPWYFILFLTILPLIAKPKNLYIWISLVAFYAYLGFYVFLAEPHTTHLYARYIYPALPFFILLLATSISYIVTIPARLSQKSIPKMAYVIISVIFLATIFNVNNTIIATKAELTTEDERRIISVAYNDYTELISVLNENNFTKNEVVLASELRMKDTIAWYFDFDFYEGRNASSYNDLVYDIADNIYVLDESNDEILKNNTQGWIIRRDGADFPKSISEETRGEIEPREELKELGIEITYYGTYSGEYEVYRWSRNAS